MPRLLREYKCQWCGKDFQSRAKDAIACSPQCRGKLARTKQGDHPWRDEEIAVLERGAGSRPFQDLVKLVQQVDRRHGWKPRTALAVKVKLRRLGLKCDCVDDNLSLQTMAETLGITIPTIHRWRKFHDLPARQVSTKLAAVSLKAFREWARTHEHLLAGLEFDRLWWVLDDEEWAGRLSAARSNRPGERIRVRRVDTGEEFPSLMAAARSHGVYISPTGLTTRSSKGQKRFVSGGIEWEMVG